MKRLVIGLAALVLVASACGGDDTEPSAGGGTPTPTPTQTAATCSPSGTALEIAAKDIAFDKDCLAAPAGQAFTVALDNQESLPHNVAIYRTSDAMDELFKGEIFSGPEKKTYQVDALEAGTYFFRCDVHPGPMTGTFVVA